ncbi:hatching enzyme 1.2-like [Triplophysa dalaica]|uniref:hatching enzyme 1.2-like n=1 Tax=Triplophysa dalaica TaxID=1582913 RepID=UPI0024DFA6EB|nr:hatching enzyme 1.2-like [Triplophysa dalaica]XP_056592526.1 hatching enzyme 1.2-like [Triplophysa dalaica]
MLLFLLLVGCVCQVWGGPLEKQKTSEIQYDEGYINSLSEKRPLPTNGEVALADVEDDAVQEGDILMPRDRNAVSTLWQKMGQNVEVPYEIDLDLEDRIQDITDALAMISDKTCITFHQHTYETDYMYFSYGEGCASSVGCVGGEQRIVIGHKCSVGNICHEILHALGLYHEHSRIDRDQYITIISENIKSGMEKNFLAKDGNTLGLQYDLESILHYGNNYFSSNGGPTIVSKDNTVTIGQRTRLTALDVQKIRKLYQCVRR